MARQVHERGISETLAAAQNWINNCLIEDGSLFSPGSLWTAKLADEVHQAFVGHPDLGKDDFITKLKRQMEPASPPAQQLLTARDAVIKYFTQTAAETAQGRSIGL